MIVSSLADQLINTDFIAHSKLFKRASFSATAWRSSYGKVLKRNDHYFGSPVNVTSRIASKANKGTFWCSSEFINQVSNTVPFTFLPKGKYTFKYVSEDIDVFELMLENINPVYIDPVCRMLIHKMEKATPHPYEQNVFFCSYGCLGIYLKTPKGKVAFRLRDCSFLATNKVVTLVQ